MNMTNGNSAADFAFDDGHWRHWRLTQIYNLQDVEGALSQGLMTEDDARSDTPDTAVEALLARILARGEIGARRTLLGPDLKALERLEELSERAPHLKELTALVRRHIQAALVMQAPLTLPPLLLLGPTGTGKTWFMAKLTEAIGVPYRLYPMSGSTLGEGLQGSHPVWRDSRPGLVARTLLSEPTANFLVVVDEIDKAADHGGSDPFRPFYGLLDRSNSVNFVDEFLGFPIDASAISWVATANDIADIPSAVLDRLMIIEVPEMDSRQRIIVARSIYADINARHGGYFDGQLPQSVVQRVLDINPRRCRIAIEDALIRAAADGRRLIEPEDVQPVKAVSKRRTALH